jgi:hypothetical protein
MYDQSPASSRRYLLCLLSIPVVLTCELLSLSTITYFATCHTLECILKCLCPLYWFTLFHTCLLHILLREFIPLHTYHAGLINSRIYPNYNPRPRVRGRYTSHIHSHFSKWLGQRRSSVSYLSFRAVPIPLV